MTIEVTAEAETSIDFLTDGLELSCNHEDGGVVVYALGELDAASSVRLRRLLTDLIRLRTQRIVVDMSGVRFMDSSGLGALLANRVAAEGIGLTFGIANPSAQVARVLEITGTYDRLVSS